ncbi:MAG TPA: FtsX-like permease family protein, partial [Herpetosiphonaceae bacterium]|nr:FtsX-like permease family protein [Herpetosiphonaceae bacterium]
QLKDEPRIAGLTGALSQPAAIIDQRSGLGEPLISLLGLGPEFDAQFGLSGDAAATARVADLAPGEIYLNRYGAGKLQAQPGDSVQVYAGPTPLNLKVRAIIGDDGLLTPGAPVAVLPLAEAQRLLNKDGAVSAVLIAANAGDAAELTERLRISLLDEGVAQGLIATLRTPEAAAALAAEHKGITDNEYLKEKLGQLQAELKAGGTSDALRSLLADGRVGEALLNLDLPAATKETLGTQLKDLSLLWVDDVKEAAIADAEQAGAEFSQIFLVFSTFSILAGVLLVFLIFVMLAAERKSEMGMARAVGMKRRHLIQMFVTEGAIYDLLAALVGVGLGVAISYAMVGVISGALGSFSETGGLQIVYSIRPGSILLSYAMGVALTFMVVTFSSWRVSRLNIVAAIRDLPEELEGKLSIWRRLWRWSRGLLLLGLGALLTASGYAGESVILVGIGVSLGLIGAGLTLGMLLSLTPLRAAVRDRLVYTLLGVALLALWLLPFDTRDALLGTTGYEQSEAIFFLAGLMMISGAIWVIVYNADLLLGLLNRVFGRFGNAAPILKTATSYPLAARFRTGMALAMFALVMFTIIAMVVVVQVNEQFFARRDELTAGFDLQASVLDSAAIGDLGAALAGQPEVRAEDIEAIAAVSFLPMELRQVNGSSPAWSADRLMGLDATFAEQSGQHYKLRFRAPGYADDAAVWQALRERDDVIVVSQSEVHYSATEASEPYDGRFYLEGVTWQDKSMPAIQVEMRDPQSGATRTL